MSFTTEACSADFKSLLETHFRDPKFTTFEQYRASLPSPDTLQDCVDYCLSQTEDPCLIARGLVRSGESMATWPSQPSSGGGGYVGFALYDERDPTLLSQEGFHERALASKQHFLPFYDSLKTQVVWGDYPDTLTPKQEATFRGMLDPHDRISYDHNKMENVLARSALKVVTLEQPFRILLFDPVMRQVFYRGVSLSPEAFPGDILRMCFSGNLDLWFAQRFLLRG